MLDGGSVDPISVTWVANGVDGDPLTFNLQYSPDNGATWEMIEQNLTATSVDVDARNIPRGTRALFRVWASDGINTLSDESDAPSVVPNHVPTVQITQPSQPTVILVGQPVVLRGEAFDIDTGTLPDEQLQWSSNLDGPLGHGGSVTTATLRQGVHTITFQADDGGGGVASATVGVTVVDICKCTQTACDCPPVPDRLIVGPPVLSCSLASRETSATISIRNENRLRTIGWEAATDAAWLELSAHAGQTPDDIILGCKRAGLDPGTYQASIAFTSAGGQSQTVAVEATVAATCGGDCNRHATPRSMKS